MLYSEQNNQHKTHLDGGKHKVHGCTLSWSQTSCFLSNDMFLEGYQIKSSTLQLAKHEHKSLLDDRNFKTIFTLDNSTNNSRVSVPRCLGQALSILIIKNVFLSIIIDIFLICELITVNNFWHCLISKVFL